jgi:hypothetical protein
MRIVVGFLSWFFLYLYQEGFCDMAAAGSFRVELAGELSAPG